MIATTDSSLVPGNVLSSSQCDRRLTALSNKSDILDALDFYVLLYVYALMALWIQELKK